MKRFMHHRRILIGTAFLTIATSALLATPAIAQCEHTSCFARKVCEAALPTPTSLKERSSKPVAPPAQPGLTTGPSDAIYEDTLDASINPKTFKQLASLVRTEDGSFLLEPGLYEADVETFSLGPVAASGNGGALLPAPIKGLKAPIIGLVLKNAELHPEIPQADLQPVLASLVTGTDLALLSPASKAAARVLLPADVVEPLLVAGQGRRLGQKAAGIVGRQLNQAANTNPYWKAAKSAKDTLAGSASVSSQPQESKPAIRGAFSVSMVRGTWVEMPGGFYLRYLPESAGKMRIQIFVPGAAVKLADVSHPLTFDPTQYLAVLTQSPYQRIGVTLRQPAQ